MSQPVNRRRFLARSGGALAAAAIGTTAGVRSRLMAVPSGGEFRGRVYKSVKSGMFSEKISVEEKFSLLKEIGFDGVELNQANLDTKEVLAASRRVGLPVHGVVDAIHWEVRLSDPDPTVRARGLEGLQQAIKDAHLVGGSAVLLVPGKVTSKENENQQQVWDRSIDEIRKALPLASRLGIHILIENVWNGFCYIHNGPENQTADLLAKYVDAIGSPWVGVYFDIGNHQKYGQPAEWIRTLGPRIVKLDVKDWGKKTGFSKMGEGDVDWAAVRKALREIRFSGWATAEVRAGDRARMREVAENMNEVLSL